MLMFAGLCNGDMQNGDLRCDANISITANGREGVRTEIKNLNSFRFLEKALECEIRRQKELIAEGGDIISQTMNYNEVKNITEPIRRKETSPDYRYFPEPDIPAVTHDSDFVKNIKYLIPEMPVDWERRMTAEYSLDFPVVRGLAKNCRRTEFADECIKIRGGCDNKFANFLINIILPATETGTRINIDPKNAIDIYTMIESDEISSSSAAEIIEETGRSDAAPREIAEKLGLMQISDENYIAELALRVVKDNPQAVEKYRSGGRKAMGFLMGEAMKISRGRANPKMISHKIAEML
jgi:aspartyl-tRNA(Asn)/glutamyl-tRNA(Gln) amidotransferase subunit B